MSYPKISSSGGGGVALLVPTNLPYDVCNVASAAPKGAVIVIVVIVISLSDERQVEPLTDTHF